MFQIPMSNQPNQSFSVVLPKNNTNISLDLFIWWNSFAGYWELNIADSNTKISLLSALPLLAGKSPVMNVLRQFSYLNIGNLYIVKSAKTEHDSPQIGDWESNFVLVWDF